MYFQHDSLDITYRRPQGAVKAGQEVELSVRAADIYGEVFLLLQDRAGERLVPLWPAGAERFVVRFRAMDEPGLIFYGFLIRQDGRDWYYCGRSGRGELREDRGELWQITVYAAEFETPAWFRRSVAYQIFPDRFCRSEHAPMAAGAAYHQRMGRKVYLHKNWAEEPLYAPHGGSRNYAPDDYYGGDLNGIREKLPYLEELGITCIYLNPIFEADSNHRYNTADYKRIDPLLGTEEDFKALCAEARERGIRIILDGVFSHTGSDSRYFDKRNRYGNGAYHHTDSPYFSWYRFSRWPERYECWWGFDTLPNVEEKEPSYGYFINGPQGVLHKWLEAGASGWRLDVADELPDCFIRDVRSRVKEEDKDNVLIGEVWEDCSNKQGSEGRRGYVDGYELDSAMNYPLRTGILRFLRGEESAFDLERRLWSLFENYPKPFRDACLNLLSSHDETRAITFLAGGPDRFTATRAEQAAFHPDGPTLARAKRLFLAGTALQLMLPGVPCIYYGDEVGLFGGGDPFNRRPYPWGREDLVMRDVVRTLIGLRQGSDAIRQGHLRMGAVSGKCFALVRYQGEECVVLLVNQSAVPVSAAIYPSLLYKGEDGDAPVPLSGQYTELFTGESLKVRSVLSVLVPAEGYCIYRKETNL